MDSITARLGAASVLLVDDSGVTRSIIRRMLGRLGVETIHEADSGASGVEKLCQLAPDLVILDWEMPDISGGKFLRIVRSPDNFPFPNTPIIVVSSHREERVVTEAFCAGVNEFLVKPVSERSLRERLIEVLVHPRKMVRVGAYYGPMPRKGAALLQSQAMNPTDEVAWIRT
jgi:CheY-like chemotaxis protein